MAPLEKSKPDLKEPTYKRRSAFTTDAWLAKRRTYNGAERLWRIHNKLYDLHEFVDKHPGGAQLLEITKGTDITEPFESHHLTDKAEKLSAKYFVRVANTLRNSPYTFQENGFYRALKNRVRKTLEGLPKDAIEKRLKRVMDALVVMTLSLSMIAGYWGSYLTATVAGLFLVLMAVYSHNFFHQKDNWRMHCFSLTLMSIRDLRISHVLSHHSFTNSLEELTYAKGKQYPRLVPDPKKSKLEHYLSFARCLIILTTSSQFDFITRIFHKTYTRSDLIGLTIPIILFIASRGSVLLAVTMWTWIVLICASATSILSFLSSSYLHPTEMPRQEQDWGVAQIDVSRDDQQAIGKRTLHTLHHLFPSVDEDVLEYLLQDVLETCKEFGINFE